MDCPICMETINASTGSTTTSCGHTFHFKCLANWCIKKVQADDHQNCPLCRHEMFEIERLPEPVEDEDEEDDESEYSEDSEESDENSVMDREFLQFERDNEEAAQRAAAGIPEFDEAAHALWVMRTTFERLDDGVSIDSAPANNQKDPANREWINLGLGIGGLVLAASEFHQAQRQRSNSM